MSQLCISKYIDFQVCRRCDLLSLARVINIKVKMMLNLILFHEHISKFKLHTHTLPADKIVGAGV